MHLEPLLPYWYTIPTNCVNRFDVFRKHCCKWRLHLYFISTCQISLTKTVKIRGEPYGSDISGNLLHCKSEHMFQIPLLIDFLSAIFWLMKWLKFIYCNNKRNSQAVFLKRAQQLSRKDGIKKLETIRLQCVQGSSRGRPICAHIHSAVSPIKNTEADLKIGTRGTSRRANIRPPTAHSMK